MKQIVTLTTDWLDKSLKLISDDNKDVQKIYPIGDHYVAQLKGILRQVSHDIEIIDITHSIQSFNIIQTGFILRNVYSYFPRGTIHLVGINSEPSPKNKIALVKHNGHYFVGANNGMFSLIFDDSPKQIRELVPEIDIRGFAALGIFADVVRNILNNVPVNNIGLPCEMEKRFALSATFDQNGIFGEVAFVDHFGNLVTNISETLFDKISDNRHYSINVRNIKITKLSNFYDDVKPNNDLALFNSGNLLEIARCNSNLSQLESIGVGESVKIEFANNSFMN